MKCSEENVILRGIFYVASCFPLHFKLYRENLDYFSDSVDNEYRVPMEKKREKGGRGAVNRKMYFCAGLVTLVVVERGLFLSLF